MRVAYTLEQCWHRVPGGTAVAALEVARELTGPDAPADLELVGVAGRHRHEPAEPWRPPMPVRALPLGAPLLYDAWLRARRPAIEQATGPVDVAHATTLIPCPSRAPLVVTVHDLAWRHEPEHFTRRGVRIFEASLAVVRERAALVLCSSLATMHDCEAAGLPAERLRHVPLGVRPGPPPASPDTLPVDLVPEGPYLAFVGTIEPRKNLARLVQAVQRLDPPLPLVVIGPTGWGAGPPEGAEAARVRFTGPLPAPERDALVAGAVAFCYPSIREGFGLPVLEAMALGIPVVTSRGTATQEAAGGAAVLVDPLDVDDIAHGIDVARRATDALREAGRARAAEMTWRRTADLTVAAYREVAA